MTGSMVMPGMPTAEELRCSRGQHEPEDADWFYIRCLKDNTKPEKTYLTTDRYIACRNCQSLFKEKK